MILEKLKSLFSPRLAESHGVPHEVFATAVLLAEAAQADGKTAPEEQAAAVSLLGRHFSLPAFRSSELFARAAEVARDSVDLYSHSKIVKDAFSYEERLEIIGMLWEVVYADGVLDDWEANIMRRLNRLLYVEDVDSGVARKKALIRLGLT